MKRVWGPLSLTQPGSKHCLKFFHQHRHPSYLSPPLFPHNDIPFVSLSWLHFCLMLASLQLSPHGLGISILHACGRLCPSQPLSRPPVLFPPKPSPIVIQLYKQRTQQGNPTICWEAESPGYHLKGCGVRQNKFKCRLSLISRVTLV